MYASDFKNSIGDGFVLDLSFAAFFLSLSKLYSARQNRKDSLTSGKFLVSFWRVHRLVH